MKNITIRTFFSLPAVSLFAVLASVTALGFAFFMQYAKGLDPCHLCLWQRWPYGVAIVIASAAFLVSRRENRALATGLMALCGLIFLAEAGLAFFHAGVEQHWWPSPFEACTFTLKQGEDILEQIRNKPAARCDEIAWSFLGLSMAGWNAAMALVLADVCLATAVLALRRKKP